jgi:hypothetical protein
MGAAGAVSVGAAYMTGSATADAGSKAVVLPIPATVRASLSHVAAQQRLPRSDSGLLRLAYRVDPTLLHAAALRTVSPFRLADPGDAVRDLDCLTAAVYYEARGESRAGQAAVAQVVLNRVRSPAFPKTVCGVVYQGAAQHACQFSFVCSGQMAARHDSSAWDRARDVAGHALGGYVMSQVGGATHFHVAALGALWNGSMVEVARVGQHVFYGFGGRRGALMADAAARNSRAVDTIDAAAQKTPTPVADKPVVAKAADAPPSATAVSTTAQAAAPIASATSS